MNEYDLFNQIVLDLDNAHSGKMFGTFCVKSEKGKVAAIFWQGNVLFKLNKGDMEEALSLQGASPAVHLYDPSKPMTGWVLIPATYSGKWKYFASKALVFVNS